VNRGRESSDDVDECELTNVQFSIFIARQHAKHAERDIVMANLSVCPMAYVLCLNKCTYRHTFWHSGRGIILFFL